MPIDTAQLYEAHGPMVLRRCRRMLRDDGKALDAMHDVFVEVLRREQTLDQRAPAGLLLRTATNVCLNKLRTERRHPEDREEELLFAIAAHGEESPESLALARRMLDRLFCRVPTSSRVMAVLHYVRLRRWGWPGLAAGCSLVAALLLLREVRHEAPDAVQAGPVLDGGNAGVTAKGLAPQLVIYRQREGGAERLGTNRALHARRSLHDAAAGVRVLHRDRQVPRS